MRRTEVTKPMFLLDEQEQKAATGQVHIGMYNHKKKNYEVAVSCFLAAAKLGHPVAQYVLGFYYESGLGVPKDAHMAFQLYLEAARHGHIKPQRMVRLHYLDGRGTQRDLEMSLAWLETAGEAGDFKACERVVQLYEQSEFRDRERQPFGVLACRNVQNIMFRLLGPTVADRPRACHLWVPRPNVFRGGNVTETAAIEARPQELYRRLSIISAARMACYALPISMEVTPGCWLIWTNTWIPVWRPPQTASISI